MLDKVDGWKVVHQLEMILVHGCRDLFNKNLKLKFWKQVFATHQRQEVGAWSSSKSQRIVLVDKQVLLTALNLEDDDEQK